MEKTFTYSDFLSLGCTGNAVCGLYTLPQHFLSLLQRQVTCYYSVLVTVTVYYHWIFVWFQTKEILIKDGLELQFLEDNENITDYIDSKSVWLFRVKGY